jgi:hypothetical protein
MWFPSHIGGASVRLLQAMAGRARRSELRHWHAPGLLAHTHGASARRAVRRAAVAVNGLAHTRALQTAALMNIRPKLCRAALAAPLVECVPNQHRGVINGCSYAVHTCNLVLELEHLNQTWLRFTHHPHIR